MLQKTCQSMVKQSNYIFLSYLSSRITTCPVLRMLLRRRGVCGEISSAQFNLPLARSLSPKMIGRKEAVTGAAAAAVPSLDAGDGTEHITHVVHKTATLSSKAPRSCLGLLHFFHPRKYFAPPRFEPVVVSSFSCVNVNEST